MKLGVREICDVVLKAKAAQKIGDKVFYKNEPVIYFDSLKTSSLEGAVQTVYAQGGRGNSRLIAWDGERTITFTMEDALISPEGISILTGAGLIKAGDNNRTIKMHTTERTDAVVVDNDRSKIDIYLSQKPYQPWSKTGLNADTVSYIKAKEDFIYVMKVDDRDNVITEPYIPVEIGVNQESASSEYAGKYKVTIYAQESAQTGTGDNITGTGTSGGSDTGEPTPRKNDLTVFAKGAGTNTVLVDYYVEKTSDTFEVDITPSSFGGNFYLEASTLFRSTDGVDLPAEFVIPNCKIQSNFTFTMASSGDPSTFTFTMDAFPGYTRFDNTKKVLAVIQVIDTDSTTGEFIRGGTDHSQYTGYDTYHKPYIEDTSWINKNTNN